VTEKPLAITMEEADELISVAAEGNLTIVCAPPDMISPYYREARRMIEAGTIGRVAFARVRSSAGGPGASWWPNDPTWFYQKGSGPLFDMGVYGIHEITGLLGPARRVVAFSGITEPTRTVRGGPFKGKEIEVTADDNTLFMLDFGNSTYASVDATFNLHTSRGPKVEIFGREGVISLSDSMFQQGAPPMEVFRVDAVGVGDLGGWIAPQSWEISMEQERAGKLRRGILVDHLVDCVWEGRHPVLSAEHARHALEIMLKIEESAQLGRVVDLETTF
jgi:predicted dehydrogenase